MSTSAFAMRRAARLNDPIPSAPLAAPARAVLPEWIDYNGHMNVGYYTIAIDTAFDLILEEWIDYGPSSVRERGMGPFILQNHLHYLDEMVEGEAFTVDFQLIDSDSKRLHVMARLLKADGRVAASSEMVLAHVDLKLRRVVPHPPALAARIAEWQAAHADLPKPSRLGAPIGLRR